MGHGFHGYVRNNQMVFLSTPIPSPCWYPAERSTVRAQDARKGLADHDSEGQAPQDASKVDFTQ